MAGRWRSSLVAIFIIYCATFTLAADDAAVLARLDALADAQLAFLEETVNVNSGTENIAGVRAVGSLYQAALDEMGFQTDWQEAPSELKRAGHLLATRTFGEGGPHVLLMGHIDTVFQADSPFQRFERRGDIAAGPGIADMKGGNAVIIYALKALVDTNALSVGRVTVFLTGDEEAPGRPLALARGGLIEIAKTADYALNFEGSDTNLAVVGRRGSSNWTLTVTGKRAHSSGVFSDDVGAGAVFEMARILNRFYGEVRGPFGLTFNPGVLAGGTFVEAGKSYATQTVFGKTNVVAQAAVVHGGLRFMNEQQKEAARAAMRKIVEDNLPHTEASISFDEGYPAMEETEGNLALFKRLNAVHTRLGLPLATRFPPERRGAADISFVAPFVASIDGLGVAGSGAHSLQEVMVIASMATATRRAALLIGDLLNAVEP